MEFESAKAKVDALLREAYQVCVDAGICTSCRAKRAEVEKICSQCHETRQRWKEGRRQ